MTEWHLDTLRLGRRVLVFEQIDSTNNLAASMADDPAHDGTAILADEQTAGRGQYGRTWLAPPGQSVLLSLLLFPPPSLCRPVVLTAWAAVAVGTLLRRLGLPPRIKWPNDVLVADRKVCGILIESRVQHGRFAAVVGIGLNVRQSAAELTAAGLPQATSLRMLLDRPFETHAIACDLLFQLDADYDRLCQGDCRPLESAWQELLGLLGRPVAAVCAGVTHRGQLLELGFEGIVLAGSGQAPQLLQPERISSLALEEHLPGV